MNIYSVVNVEHLKLYEPYKSIEDEGGLDHIFTSLDELTPNIMDELKEHFILQKKVHNIRRGEIKLWLVGLKGQKPNKSIYINKSSVGELYHHIYICATKYLFIG